MALPQRDESLTRFLACFKKPTSRLAMPIAPLWIVRDSFFFLEKHYTPQYYRLLISYVCTRLCQCFGQGGCYCGCDKPCTCSYTRKQRFLLQCSCVADTFWSVHIKCCFHKKKTKT